MRITVAHSTVYRYQKPVHPEPHTFRFRPREDAAQHLVRFALEISPSPAGMSECLDQDGNVVTEAWFNGPLTELAAHSSFEVETRRENPFDFLPHGPAAPYPEPLRSALAPYLEAGNPAGPVSGFAHAIAERESRDTLPFLTALNQRLFETFDHVTRDDGPAHPPEITLVERQGTCRDLAVLFCSACRSMGIAARFVSGYEREAASQERADMHAWAEVYLQGGGWRGYDPSQGLAVATAHVAVAAAADPRLAAPISGLYRGDARSEMQFTISMEVEESR
ncbi:MAG: transglutaminase family protein [Bryobacteraceae bacterium]|jgi:transglutaminase-like putative cysteine protease